MSGHDEAGPAELTPIQLPDFGDDDLATEALDTGVGGTELPERYEVRESLGREGDADVFRATDRRLGRTVLLMVLREDAPSHVRRAFEDDARTVAQIDHPGATTLYDIGELPDGRLFVTRGEIEGRPLGRWAREVEVRRVVRWLAWATETLAAAQRVGIVHRRLEPELVVVGRTVKVSGFGAGVAEPSPFMAPELVRGDPSDQTADVFSMGAIALDVLGDGCPADLRAVFERAVAVDAGERQPSAEALLADLVDWLDA